MSRCKRGRRGRRYTGPPPPEPDQAASKHSLGIPKRRIPIVRLGNLEKVNPPSVAMPLAWSLPDQELLVIPFLTGNARGNGRIAQLTPLADEICCVAN